MAAGKMATGKKKLTPAEIAADDTIDEDVSALLRVDDTSERKAVSTPLWLAIDWVIAFGATFATHSVWPLEYRLVAATCVTAFAFVAQLLYFNSGLDRPASGEMPIDKWWHMLLVHVGNVVFFWEFCFGMYSQIMYWKATNTNALLALIYFTSGFYLVIWACDLIAGLVHWFGDTTEMYFFTYHHEDSRYMTRQSYVHHTWETFALALALSYTVAPFLRTVPIAQAIRLIACQGNECHMWSHCLSSEIPPVIKRLQDLTLVLSWKSHKHHHKPPYLRDYCVFNGWANPFMNIVLPGPATNAVVRLRETKAFQWVKRTLDT